MFFDFRFTRLEITVDFDSEVNSLLSTPKIYEFWDFRHTTVILGP